MQPILIFFAYAFEMRFVNFCQFSTDNKKKRYNREEKICDYKILNKTKIYELHA